MEPTRQQLQKSCNEMRSINKRVEKSVRYLESKAAQLGMSYVLFQILMFMSVSEASNISCGQQWIPLSMSLTVAVVFSLSFGSTVSKWRRTKYEYDLNVLEQEMMYSRMELGNGNENEMVLKGDMLREYKRKGCIFLMGCALLGYTIVILIGSHTMLCH